MAAGYNPIKIMTIEDTEQEMNIRLYRWALQDFQREVHEGYTLLKTVQHQVIIKYLTFVIQMSIDEQLEMAETFVKCQYPQTIKVLGQDISAADRARREQYFRAIRTIDVTDAFTAPAAPWLLPPDERGTKVKRSKMAQSVLNAVSTEVGMLPEKIGGNVWLYRYSYQDCTLEMHLDFSATWAEPIRCHHLVRHTNYPFVLWNVSRFSVPSLYGVHTLAYNVECEYEVARAAMSMAAFSRHTWNAAPVWFEGI
jgi:hypothetical protein